MKASAKAPSNVALVKYWGRRDNELTLPYNSSFSMTFDSMHTKTTVEFNPELSEDAVIINNEEQRGEKRDRAVKHLQLIRELAGVTEKAKIQSENNFLTAAGFASSASGFAALTFAASRAAGLKWSDKELSIYSRRSSSGSAARSIHGGFVEWHRGQQDTGMDSYAESFKDENHWPEFRVLACVLTQEEKKVSSAAGMQDTVDTCPFYHEYAASAEKDLEIVKKSVEEKDLKTLGERSEHNCLKLHSSMLSTIPSLIYWEPATIKVMKELQAWRKDGLNGYFTIDAGPQVKVVTTTDYSEDLKQQLNDLSVVQEVIENKPGPGAIELSEHLF